MTHAELQESNVDSEWLVNLVSDCLRLPAGEIDRAVPLVRYGLDSLGAVQLTTAIASELCRDVPETLLLDHPDINSLEGFVHAARNSQSGAARVDHFTSNLDQMSADCVLPDDVRPEHRAQAATTLRAVLLTGATGFLGAYLLRALLRETSADIYCLVRPEEDVEVRARIRDNLESYAIWDPTFASRLHVIAGDLLLPALGLDSEQFDGLGRDIDEIYHCAAAVNWVLPYAGLRDANVLGTLELLRLACRFKPKPFHFVSTLATCYSSSRHDEVTEQDDMLSHLHGIHLGYAQSKCVAETLVRRAAERGLPATIHRPTLISGDGKTGTSNQDDLLSTMIRGCIQMGSAPDLDWVLDCCPVDYAADAIVGLTRLRSASLRAFHLVNPTTRHWREVVLWMNLFGYPIKLDPFRDWLARLKSESATPDHPLHRLRSFFLTRYASADNLTLPELYEDSRRSRVGHHRTQETLSTLSVRCPALDVRLLDRYFQSFIERRILPTVAGPIRGPAPNGLTHGFFEQVLRRYYDDDTIRIQEVSNLQGSWQNSITTELTSWRYGTAAGLSQHRVIVDSAAVSVPRSLELFVKVKAKDRDVMDVAESVSAVCSEEVGRAFAKHKHRIGIAGCHIREGAIYDQQDDRFRKHVPAVFATVRNDERHEWILVLERLTDMVLMDSAANAGDWHRQHVEAALRGIAEIHSIWYGREDELAAQSWLGPTLSAATMAEMTDLWKSLADYSLRYFTPWLGRDICPLLQDLITDVGRWWQPLEQIPRTLIHNDFNPRNIAFRSDKGTLRLCTYDWELATLGVPQHDLAELLCFVLPPECSRDLVIHYLDVHRQALETATGQSIDPVSWQLGFQLSLRDLIVNRFPMYCLMHTFHRQPFLERVIKTWRTLYGMLLPGA